MDINLTPQQAAAIRAYPGQPVGVIDDASSQRFYLVPEQAYLHLQGLSAGTDEWCHEQLKRLIQEGIDSPDVPAAETFLRLRARANELARDE